MVDFGGFRWISVDFAGFQWIWPDLATSGEIWRDVGFRARMAIAAPIMGLRRDHIGFRLVFRNLYRKC